LITQLSILLFISWSRTTRKKLDFYRRKS